jgi:CHAT domain-containing protein/Tfp pilus assembly protein PilF
LDLPVIVSLWLLLFQAEYRVAESKQNYFLFQRSFQYAVSCGSRGEFERASANLLIALSISRQLNYSYGQSRCLLRLAIIKWDLGRIAESSEYLNEAQSVFKNVNDRRAEEYCLKLLKIIQLYNQGKAARDAKSYYISIEKYEQAIYLGRETGFAIYELKCLRQMGLTYWQMGKINLYLESNINALEISNRINHKIEKGRCLNSIGVYYHKKNDYTLALNYYENAVSIIKETDDQPTEAECLSNIGILYRDLGNLTKAQQYLSSALELDKKAGDIDSISIDMNNIGSIYLRTAIDRQNMQALLQASDVFHDLIALKGVEKTSVIANITALNNLGVIQSEMKDYLNARKYFYLAIKNVEKGNYLSEKCQILNNIAVSFVYDNNIDNAIEYFSKALEIGSEQSYENIMMESCLGLGQCYEIKKKYSISISYYRRSIEAIEHIWDRIPNEFFKIGFARNKMTAYQRIIGVLVSQHNANPHMMSLEEIFNFVERAKARAFFDNIRETWEESAKGTNTLFFDRQQEISKKISVLYRKMISYGVPIESKKKINIELEREEEKYIRLISEIRTEARSRSQKISKEICSISQLQDKIRDDKTLILEYFIGEEESYLIIIKRNNAKIYVLSGRDDLERSLRGYIKLFSFSSNGNNVGVEAAKRIGKELIPIKKGELFEDAEAIIVIPDGILHYLPFETLRAGIGRGSGYLVEKLVISYCPSASSLFYLKEQKKRSLGQKMLLALGGPNYGTLQASEGEKSNKDELSQLYREQGFRFPSLPFSKREVSEIGKLFEKNMRTILVGEKATEEAIKKLPLNEYRLIHFACHGFLDERNPFRSALVLSLNAQKEDDGYLQMREIYGLALNADLVVLSACQAGSGIMESAEGPMGLARPFFYAGARSVIASLWSINDKTTVIFMKEFYRNLVEGRAIGKALQLAKIRMINSAWSHPYYWAGFILNGDSVVISMIR